LEDVDRQIGRILEALQRTGQEDNTLIIFTSDHGEGLASHRWCGKQMFYEEEVGVPLIVSYKGVTPPGRIDRTHLVSTLDVLPTICDYAGIPAPALVRGKSLRGIIEDPDHPGHEYVVSEMSPAAPGGPRGAGRSFMVRTAKHKYMFFPGSGGQSTEVLFDMEADSDETKDLTAEPALASVLARHRELLAEWRRATLEDKCPIPPPRPPRTAKARK
jgi:arylsulfatase A-like enzyme